MSQTIFVGDVHGCAVELDALLGRMDLGPSDRLLLAGDAFTRGPDPVGVWRTIERTSAEMVLGNHDEKLLQRLRRRLAGKADRDTLKVARRRDLDALMSVAPELVAWLEGLPLSIEGSGAGVDWVLVHAGVNPEKGLAGTTREEFLKIRTWPPIEGIEGPRWHDHYQDDGRLIVFGHDAPGGLVIKKRPDEDRPYLLGLDTGCCFGGRLTAYVLENNRIVQVPGRKPDRPPG